MRIVRIAALQAALVAALVPGVGWPAAAASDGLVISQVYPGGGNTGAAYFSDFVELFNRSRSTVTVGGWSIQYASASGTTWSVDPLPALQVPPGGYYLVRERAGRFGGPALPTPDDSGSLSISRTAGKIALVSGTTPLTGAAPSRADIVDLLGYGTTVTMAETAPAAAPSDNTQSMARKAAGCSDSDNNRSDFAVVAASPRNSATPAAPCNRPPVLDPVGDRTVAEGQNLSFSISATDPDGDPLTFRASNLPPGASFVSSTARFSWTPSYSQSGIYGDVRFSVTDGSAVDAEKIAVTVTDAAKPPSTTTLTVESTDRIEASGTVTPRHPGSEVVVKLFRKVDGVWQLLRKKTPVLDADSRYAASFARPATGRCRVTARFWGDGDHASSFAKTRFPC